MHRAGKAQCRWSRLTSNVRPHKNAASLKPRRLASDRQPRHCHVRELSASPSGFAAHRAAWALRAQFNVTLRRPSIGQKLLLSFGWRLKSPHAKCFSAATQPMQRYCASLEAAAPPSYPSTAVELQASVRPKCGLTLRSRRGPTALHQAREAPRHIMCLAGLAQRRWSHLNSNVRPRNRSRAVLQQSQRLPA